jgi:hypothetical protein
MTLHNESLYCWIKSRTSTYMSCWSLRFEVWWYLALDLVPDTDFPHSNPWSPRCCPTSFHVFSPGMRLNCGNPGGSQSCPHLFLEDGNWNIHCEVESQLSGTSVWFTCDVDVNIKSSFPKHFISIFLVLRKIKIRILKEMH